jgi:CheY-like chemotaxis protein
MPRIVYFHWNFAEAQANVARLRSLGLDAEVGGEPGPPMLRELTRIPPDAILIDLSRLPSHGREVAGAIRARKSTRSIPLVFLGGEPDKVERVRAFLPDAAFCTWDNAAEVIEHAITHPPDHPVSPESGMAAYAGTPLPAKLGIKPGMVVAVHGAPRDLGHMLGDLPAGAYIEAGQADGAGLAIWFVRDRAGLDRDMAAIVLSADGRPVWIAWPKQSGPIATDLTQQDVRKAGLAGGLVDYKVCSISDAWSGLLFRKRL